MTNADIEFCWPLVIGRVKLAAMLFKEWRLVLFLISRAAIQILLALVCLMWRRCLALQDGRLNRPAASYDRAGDQTGP